MFNSYICWLVGQYTHPSEKYESIGMMIPKIWENKTCSKPSTSVCLLEGTNHNFYWPSQASTSWKPRGKDSSATSKTTGLGLWSDGSTWFHPKRWRDSIKNINNWGTTKKSDSTNLYRNLVPPLCKKILCKYHWISRYMMYMTIDNSWEDLEEQDHQSEDLGVAYWHIHGVWWDTSWETLEQFNGDLFGFRLAMKTYENTREDFNSKWDFIQGISIRSNASG